MQMRMWGQRHPISLSVALDIGTLGVVYGVWTKITGKLYIQGPELFLNCRVDVGQGNIRYFSILNT